MDTKKRILWITRTAVFIALLVALQFLTSSMGQYVTGSVVNLLLILSVMLGGLACGVTVALLSPVFAFLLGIGPQILPIIPFIMVGNLVIVLVWHFIAGKANPTSTVKNIIATVAGAVAKFAALYLGIAVIASRLFTVPPPMLAMMSYPQLITAGIGGAVAVLVLPLLSKVIKE